MASKFKKINNHRIDVLAGLFYILFLGRTEGLHSTRLETRTKESSLHASAWVANPSA